jgi:hypothetical protein
MDVPRKFGWWAGLKVARRLGKSVPLVGTAISIAVLAQEVKRKGLVGGVVNTGLDALPFFGALKNGIELVTDDWIPDLPPSRRIVEATATAALDDAPPAGPTSPTPS